VVIDVLRGAQNSRTVENGYQQLSTFGIAADVPWRDWQQYLIQLINQGYIEIAFHDQNKLRLTPLSKNVLFEKEKVRLAQVQQSAASKPDAKTKTQAADSLFERLRKLRLEIAKEEELPAYLIFNDATLKEMELARPMTDEDFMHINGVGRRKMETYGYRFIKEIISFSKEKRVKKSKKKGNTYKETLELYRQGLSVEEIAQKRKIAIPTVFSHLAKLYQAGEDIDLKQFVAASDLQAVSRAKEELGDPKALKPYYEHLGEAVDYGSIRLSLTILERTG
jgi:ATP-dependent DNA helicase RecQ